jgi:processive 1,2-diacylglycerol beta-glucosyltransferase
VEDEEGMIDLFDNDTQSLLGQITDSQLRFLVDNLEETDRSDRDYYLDVATLELLEEEGTDAALVQLLRDALQDREGMEIRWEEAD